MMQPGGARVRCCRLNSTNTGHRKSFQLTRKDSMPRVGVNRAAFVTRTDPFPAVSSRRPTCRSLPGRRSPVRQNGRVTLLTRCYTTFFQRCKALDPLARSRHQRLPGVRGGAAGRMLWTYRNVLSLYENPLHSGW